MATRLEVGGRVLRHAASDAVAGLLNAGREERLKRGEAVRGRRVHVVVDGRLSAKVDGRVLWTWEPGDVLDPRGLPAGTRVWAPESARTTSLTGSAWDRFLGEQPAVASEVAETRHERGVRMVLLDVLDEVFQGLSDEASDALARLAEVVHVPAGEVVCREGDAARTAFLVLRGRLRASRTTGSGPVVLGELGRGAIAGEQALLRDATRRATLRAVRDADVAVLHRNALDVLLAEGPDAVAAIVSQVLDRAARTTAPDTDDHLLAFLPTGDAELAMRVAEQVMASLPDGRTGVIVGSAQAAEAVGSERAGVAAEEDAALQEWLNDLEDTYDVVALVTDAAWTSWTRRCTRQADRLLLVADATADPGMTAVEKALAFETPRSVHASRSLLLVQPDEIDLPRGTRHWLDARDVDAHYHLRLGVPEDAARLARFLAGRPVGLALGGGGARGFAELGAITAMHECGLPIDVVTGTSIGAVLGAALAKHLDPARTQAMAARGFRDVRELTLPLASVMHGGEVWTQLTGEFGDLDLADLWLPFACMSTDMTAGQPVAHRRGPVAQAVRASIALPGLLTPVAIDGHLHVDGGILDNLPVDALRELEPRAHVVAVDVAPPRGPRATHPIPEGVSGWNLLLRALVPGLRPPPVPSIAKTILQSTMVGASRKRTDLLAAGAIDCHVALDVGAHALTEFHLADQIAEVGRAGARPQLDAWIAEHPNLPRLAEGGATGPMAATPLAEGTPAAAPATSHRSKLDRRQLGNALQASAMMAVRDLRHRVRRVAVSILGTAVILTLAVVLGGLVSQFDREPAVAMEGLGATHWVVPEGVVSPFTAVAPFGAAQAAEVTGSDATPVLVARLSLEAAGETGSAMVVGRAAGGLADPEPTTGTRPRNDDEVVTSDGVGIAVGDQIRVGPRELTVVGLVADQTVIAGIPLVFMDLTAAQQLVAAGQPQVSAVLTTATPTAMPAGLHVVEVDEVAEALREPIREPVKTIRLLLLLLAVVAAMILTAVTYLSTLDRERDVAVLRAMGTPAGVLAFGVGLQAVLLALSAAVIALALEPLVAAVFPMTVHVTATHRLVLPVAAVVIAVAAARGAVRRTLRVDPAAAFDGRGG